MRERRFNLGIGSFSGFSEALAAALPNGIGAGLHRSMRTQEPRANPELHKAKAQAKRERKQARNASLRARGNPK